MLKVISPAMFEQCHHDPVVRNGMCVCSVWEDDLFLIAFALLKTLFAFPEQNKIKKNHDCAMIPGVHIFVHIFA